MKKILFSLIAVLFMGLGAKAQNTVTIKGKIDTAIAGKAVLIAFNSSFCSTSSLDSAITDSAGKYAFVLSLGSCTYGSLSVSTLGCGSNHDTLSYYTIYDTTKNGDTLIYNFKYCDTGCAYFHFSYNTYINPFTLQVGFFGNANANKYFWDFGDGNTATVSTITHTYASSGTYHPFFKAWDTVKGCSDSVSLSMFIPAYDSVFVQGQIDTPINNAAVIVSQYTNWYAWWNTQTFYTNSSGYYSGWMHVLDSSGGLNASILNCRGDSVVNTGPHTHFHDTVTIDFAYCPPYNPCTNFHAAFYLYPSGKTGNFNNTSSSQAHKFNWSYGDGATSTTTATNHGHTYASDSTYTVCLIAQDTVNGCADTVCHNLVIDTRRIITGNLTLDSSSVTIDTATCRIWLIRKDSVGTDVFLTAVDSTVNSAGSYAFLAPIGNYLVKAALLPASPQYSNYLPTYHSQSFLWSGASNVAVGSTSYTFYAHITLIKGSNPGGTGFIGGFVSVGANKVGDPIEKVDVLLLTAAGKPVSHTYTDANGEYKFNNLAFGQYKVRVEVLGKTSEEYLVTLDQNNASASNGNFEVNTKDIKVKKSSTGIAPIATRELSIYPNPASSVINIIFEAPSAENITVTITDIAGKVVKTNVHAATSGNNTLALNIEDLQNGVYIIGFQSANVHYMGRIAINK